MGPVFGAVGVHEDPLGEAMSDCAFTVAILPPLRSPRPEIGCCFARLPPVEWGPPLRNFRGTPGMPFAGMPERASLWAMLRSAWRRQRTRRCIARLDAHALKDIGVSYAEAEAEVNKPFWVP